MPRRLHHEAREGGTSKAGLPRPRPCYSQMGDFISSAGILVRGRPVGQGQRRTAGASLSRFPPPPFSVKRPSPFSPTEDLAAAPLVRFFCLAALVPLCWPDRHSRQHSPACFRLVHDAEGEGEVGGAGAAEVWWKTWAEEAAAWFLGRVWTRAWYHSAQSQHENICLWVF